MTTVNIFFAEICLWLTPLGYTLQFQNNESQEPREFHFIKDGIRVVCVNNKEPYCYFSNDILTNVFNYTVKSQRFHINTPEINTVIQQLKTIQPL